ncbi:MAG: phenylalanine--tRNA ligase subunit alpha [Candidatus Thermoplasmatota archaeon]
MKVEELSSAERRVLLALSKLGGTGTPWEIIRSSAPEDVAAHLSTMRQALLDLESSAGRVPKEREVDELMRALLTIIAEEKEDYRGEVTRVLASRCLPSWVGIEVPLQRKGFAHLTGDAVPAISSALSKLAVLPEEKRDVGLLSQVEVMNAVSWLQAKGLVLISETLERYYSLARKHVAGADLPERKALKALRKMRGKARMDELGAAARLSKDDVSIAVGWLKRKGWARIEKVGGETILVLTEEGKEALERKGKDEETIALLGKMGELHEREIDEVVLRQLTSRQGLLRTREEVMRWASLAPAAEPLIKEGLRIVSEVSQLTPQHLVSGAWKNLSFRPYAPDTYAPAAEGGKRHPLCRFIAKIRETFMAMGFTEVEFGYVQSTFWNMDALFTPQDHPVREMQDTFYLSQPSRIPLPMQGYVKKVRKAHEEGIDGSLGWGYAWREEDATKAILRTHTTVNSILYLSEHPDPPVRIFTIGRVFRRESIDARHLAEFQMVEGIAMEEDASLAMLKGILTEYYRRMGFEQIRIRPSYFPYTEPSMEVETFYAGRWMELGGAGMFRPEVLAPFGIKHPVMAWGQGLERLAMVLFGLEDMRALYNSDVDWLRKAPVFF